MNRMEEKMDMPKSNEVMLEKLRFALVNTYPAGMIEDVSFDFVEWLERDLTVKVRGYVMAEDVGKEIFSYPADWWQAVKERFFPDWLLKKYPVKYRRITLNVKATYPEFRPALPNQTLRYRVLKHEDWWA